MTSRFDVLGYVSRHLAGLVAVPVFPSELGGNNTTFVATHDGSFHVDEAMACGLLRHTELFASCGVVRSRVPAQHVLCCAVVDVGGVYDPSRHLYDHHQLDFQERMNTGTHQYATRMSSAGLIYKHFGKQILSQYADACLAAGAISQRPTSSDLELLYDRVYKGFVEHIDGVDNGVEEYCASSSVGSGGDKEVALTRNYILSSSISTRVGRLFPRWTEGSTRADEDAAFVKAVSMCTVEFFEAVDFYLCSWLPGRQIVQAAFHSANTIHPSEQIMVLPKGNVPWKEHLEDVERDLGCLGKVVYVLFSDGKGWRVQCVSKVGSSFQNRKSLPWVGLRDDDLVKASGIEGGVFVHATGFIGGNKTYEGALAMAEKALAM
jgi:uncharacterized UPF0160 family protein